ncbi:hypothetical protein J2W56_006809 [Nocardia kruczakiae]|uniref:Acyl-CoA dehydrogenase-like protein n=1 Tax=Nocardia kruczakiae TaxID=261477 RepID=A0ABU1XR57_9NOCA|nr:hypothetical protein [Nocardia kruczakiae]
MANRGFGSGRHALSMLQTAFEVESSMMVKYGVSPRIRHQAVTAPSTLFINAPSL